MSKISTYEVTPVPKLADKLIGTSVGGEIEDITYNFTLSELLNLFIPNIPANTLQGILDYGNTATQDIILYGTIYTTNIEVTNTATILNSYLTGETHVTGGLYDRLNSKGTSGQVLRSTGTGIEWYTVPTVIPTLQQVLTSGNTADVNIILSSNIEAITATADNVVSDISLSVNGSLKDKDASVGSSGQVLSSTGTKVQWVNLPVYTATTPLSIDSITRVISIQKASSTQDGYLSSADWITFDGKQNGISLTTFGSSGPSTLIGSTINVPNYTLGGLGGVPESRILTINGVSYNLSQDRTWTIAAGTFSVVSPLLSTGGLNPIVSIQQAGSTLDGYLSSLDWIEFNSKLSSVALSMPSAFSVANSPLTSDGEISVTGAGTNLQYIDGTGALRTFPGLTGYVPYTGATANVDLGIYNITAAAIIKNGGVDTQFLKADGSIDNNTYLTANDLPSTLSLYATTAAASVSGYFKLVTTIDDPDFNTIPVDVSTGAITATDQLISSLISPANLINGNPGVFNVTTYGNIKKVSGSGESEFYFKIYKRSSAGVETLVGTSSNTIPVVNTGYSEFFATAIWNDGDFGVTDTIVLKYYATRIGGGSNPTYNFQFGGVAPVRTIVPIPTAVIPNIYLEELADVEDGIASNNDGIYYDSAVSLWKYKSIAEVLGYTPANDSLVVHLAGTETITGSKTFTANPIITNSGGAYVQINSGVGSSSSIAFTNNNTNVGFISVNSVNFSLRNYVSTEFRFVDGIMANGGVLAMPSASLETYTFPAATGTIALLESAQSFSGQNTFTDITFFNQSASFLYGAAFKKGNTSSVMGLFQTDVFVTSALGNKNLVIQDISSSFAKLQFQDTGNLTYTFPAASGTVALVGDLSGYVPYTGATGSVTLGIYNITAASLIKSGGTSAQILAADGSVITAGTNITISGGTISASGGGGSMEIGGAITGATTGSVLFAGVGGILQQDNANFFWDDTNNRLGIGTAIPANTLDVIRGTAGTMARGVYESGSFSYNGDMKLGLYTSSSIAGNGASLIFGQTQLTSTGGVYPGFELQYVYNSGTSNSMRINAVSRSSAGTVTAATTDIFTVSQGGRVGINLAVANIGSSLQVNGNAAIGYSASTAAPTNGLAVSGRVGIGLIAPLVSLEVLPSTTNSSIKTGAFEIQSYSVNNTWFGDNIYFNGTTFVRRAAGYTGMFYFYTGEGQFRFGTSSTAGSAVNNGLANQGGLIPLKMNVDGSVALGNLIEIPGTYTGAKFLLNSSGNIGLNIVTPANIGSQLQINGNAAIGYSASTAAPTNGLAVNGAVTIANSSAATYALSLQSSIGISIANAFSLNYFNVNALTTNQGIAVQFTPNGIPTNNAYVFQFNKTQAGTRSNLLIVGSGLSASAELANNHVFAVDNTGASNGLVLRVAPTNTGWAGASVRNNFTIFSTGNIVIQNAALGATDAGYKLDVLGTFRSTLGAVVGYSATTAAPTNGLAVSGQVGIGLNTPVASAALQVSSTTQGFLPPTMTSAQKTAIATPSTGLIIYQSDGVEGLYIYSGASWKSLTMV